MTNEYHPRGKVKFEENPKGILHIGDGCPICWSWKQFPFDRLPNKKHHASCCMNQLAA